MKNGTIATTTIGNPVALQQGSPPRTDVLMTSSPPRTDVLMTSSPRDHPGITDPGLRMEKLDNYGSINGDLERGSTSR